MDFVRQYQPRSPHTKAHTWALRLRECAQSMYQLACIYYPPAIHVAGILSYVGHDCYEKVLVDYKSIIDGYVVAMRGRAVTTTRHYVLHGIIFISHYVVALRFGKKRANLSPGPHDWFYINLGEKQHLRMYDLTLSLVHTAQKLDQKLFDKAASTYLNLIPRDICNMIADYTCAPTGHLATLV